jgi:hypothetical protein
MDNSPSAKKVEAHKYNLSKPCIQQVLDLCTAHITLKDTKLLEDEEGPIVSYQYTYGYFIAVCEKQELESTTESLVSFGFSKQFIKIFQDASEKEVALIRFDSEGALYEDLEEFDW